MKDLSKTSLVFAAAMAMSNLQASELNIDNPHFGERGWDVQLGIGVFSSNTAVFEFEEDDFEKGVYIPLEATWYGERFYFVTSQEEGLLVGYNLTKNDVWALDAIAGPRTGGPDIDDLEDEFSGLEERDVDFHAGLRYSRYGEDSVLRLEVTRDLSNTHDGYFAFGSYKREWQVKNWLVTGGVGVGYISEDMAGYYLDVSDAESSAGVPIYSAGATSLVDFRVAAEYPINENWVFNTELGHTLIDDEVTDSPFTTSDDHVTAISVAAIYHF